MSQKITPFLWFDDNAEEAARYYVSIFKDAEILSVNRVGDAGAESPVLTASFRLNNQEFVALNGGPEYKFTPATSFAIDCASQEEVDYLWEKLSDGGETNVCGWLTDKYGLSWQVVPTVLVELLQDEDPVKANRVMQAMLQMTKIDIAKLREAYNQA
jgi:predicted 3-demethylubiquinone-9 3-methyltransferase (glyoxalase superfamily)